MLAKILIHITLSSIIVGQMIRFSLGSGAVILTDICMGVLYGYAAFYLGYKKYTAPRERLLPKEVMWPLIAWLVFVVIATISWLYGIHIAEHTGVFSVKNTVIALLYLVRMVMYTGLPWILIMLAKAARIENKHLLINLGVSAFCIAMAGFWQIKYYADFTQMAIRAGWDPHIDRLLSTWFDPNFVGALFAVVATVLFGILILKKPYLTKSKKSEYLIGAPLLGVILVALLLTYSRTGYITLVVGMSIVGMLKARRVFVIAAALVIILTLSNERAMQRIAGGVNIDVTASKRIESWMTAYKVISDHPVLGVGYNHLGPYQIAKSYVDEYDVNNRFGFENTYATIAATMGVVGVVSYFSYLGLMMLMIGLKVHKKPVVTGLLAANIGLCIAAIFINALLYAHLLVVQAILIIVAVREEESK